LGEIENQLLKLPSIEKVVVIVHENGTGEHSLCAYFVSAEDVDIATLKEYLATRLPGYMVPAHFVPLEVIPLNRNGKVDHKALPGPEIKAGEDYRSPRNEKEKKLVELWSDLLEIEKNAIGIDSNFFELGGHSLKATILVSKIHKELNQKIPLSEIFVSPTIARLAEYIRELPENVYASIQPVEEKEYYAVSAAQKRMFLLDRIKGAGVSDNTPEVMEVEGKLEMTKFEDTVKRIIQRHETLRTSFHLMDNEPVQRVHKTVEFEIDYRESGEEDVEDAIDRFVRPFDLGRAPLLRAGMLKLAEEKHVLMFDLHHIISDGTSMGILTNDFLSLYNNLELPELRVQYKDFTIWQNERLESKDVGSQEEYWQNVFSGELPVLSMPTDYPRPAVQSYEGEYVEFRFERDLAEKVRKVASESGATLYMVLLAFYNILLSKYSGQEDIIVGSAVAGRLHADLENLIGFFINTLAMRNYPSADKSFIEFLGEVKTNSLEAYENQDYQFEELVKTLSLQPDPGRHPLFDTMFVVQNVYTKQKEGIAIKDIMFIPRKKEEKITQFDIITHAFEVGDAVAFKLRYSTKLFRPEMMERFVNYYREIAWAVVKNTGIKLGDIEISHDLGIAVVEGLDEEMDDNFAF
jgi:acyl carrier protein